LRSSSLKQFQEKWVTAFRPELHKNKDLEQFSFLLKAEPL